MVTAPRPKPRTTRQRASSQSFVCGPAKAKGTVAAATMAKPATATRRAPTVSVSRPARPRDSRVADALRDEHEPRRQRGGAAHLLVVQRQQQHRAVQGEPREEQHRGRRGHRAAGQHAEVDERLPVPPGQPQRVPGEGGRERDTDRERDDDVGVREAGGAARVAQPEDDRRDAGSEQGEARQVKPRPRRPGERLVRGHEPRGEDQAGDAERHVHPEHEPPAEVGKDRAADERAEDRAEQRGQGHDGNGPAEGLAARGLHDQRGQQREHDAAAKALHDAPGDQRVDVPRQAGADRADEEDGERGHPQPLAAEPPQPPGGQRYRDAQREQVAGRHPLDRGHRRVQPRGERVQRDADDRRVEDDPEETDDQDQRGLENLRVNPVLA